jgi:PTH1 family peptidyl-tRNA hydrolase
MIVVIGLGNPGSEYAWTRHNVGFMALDRLARRYELKYRAAGLYESAKHSSMLLVKPLTYMNRSGEALKSARSRNPVDELIVVSDDYHLPLGAIRLRERGGDGGHNGLKSIISVYGAEFIRLRVGVGEPPVGFDPADYVLGRFRHEERPMIEETLDRVADLLEAYSDGGLQALQNLVSKQSSYSGKESRDQ